MDHFQQILDHLWSICATLLRCTHCIIPENLMNYLNIFCRGMFKLNTKFDADLLLYSVILNATATQYTCPLNGSYCPHWLVQWSHHCSHTCIPVPSPWLPGYIQVATHSCYITNGWIFLDRPCIPLRWKDFTLSKYPREIHTYEHQMTCAWRFYL